LFTSERPFDVPLFNTPPGENLGECSSTSFVVTGAIHAYIEFVDTGASSWTSTNKALIVNLFNGLSSSTWWPLLYAYDLPGHTFEGSTVTVASTCEVTNTTNPVSCASASFAACTSAPGWNASDDQGIYYYLPADSSISCDVHCGGEHCTPGFGGVVIAFQTDLGGPSPNGHEGLDTQVWNFSHETAEYLTDPNTINGWRCGIGSEDTEVADVCSSSWGGGPWLGSVGGQPYNLTVGSDHYVMTALWQPGVANGCYNTPPDLARVATLGNCTLASGYKLSTAAGGWCTAPTCTDGQEDGWETDVDCGGTCPDFQVTGPLSPASSGLCASGKSCQFGLDCTSAVCDAGTCQ
jgi:hypothetical protein